MRKKGILFVWLKYMLSRFGNSADAKISVQQAIAGNKLEMVKGLEKLSPEELKALVMDIRGAARDYYFKGTVPHYYKPVLDKYYRSVLYHILHQRNYD
ncbi:MAG: hypothetical protein ACK417_08100 [Bacteroidia bacterium]